MLPMFLLILSLHPQYSEVSDLKNLPYIINSSSNPDLLLRNGNPLATRFHNLETKMKTLTRLHCPCDANTGLSLCGSSTT